ncbi:MAG TPA: nucleotidyltransferase family protein [Chromatiales bacterium]|nr:nucleotidyltransferase family protein [Thiotrichales bacterium]HIP67918.1 nucleotidyltransferase family protein [Chromatiales bacterium]
MKAMILAAGRGERMRPLTDHRPKPLLQIGGTSLIEHQIRRLKNAGYIDIVINIAWLGEQIKQALGDGQKLKVNIQYSDEGETALETGGGIFKALPLLGSSHFLVVNSDVWCDHPLSAPQLKTDCLAHLILVDNPQHNSQGDFSLENGLVKNTNPQLTFSGIGWYHPDLFADCKPGKFLLAPLLREAAEQNRVSGEYYQGEWQDIGTPERLRQLQNNLI